MLDIEPSELYTPTGNVDNQTKIFNAATALQTTMSGVKSPANDPSNAFNDPNADLIELVRTIPASAFFVDMLTSAVGNGEILREIRIPRPSGSFGQAYLKNPQPASGFALVGVAVHLVADGQGGDSGLEPAGRADDATLVCRCEEVPASEIRHAARIGAIGLTQAKAYTRCGMGPCQGRLCGPTVAALVAAERGMREDSVPPYRPRAPYKPITLGALASLARADVSLHTAVSGTERTTSLDNV